MTEHVSGVGVVRTGLWKARGINKYRESAKVKVRILPPLEIGRHTMLPQ